MSGVFYLWDKDPANKKFKIQNNTFNQNLYKKVAFDVLIMSDLYVVFPMYCIFYQIIDKHYYSPTLYQFLPQLPMALIIQECWFYVVHRLFHTKYLYKYHKKHHQLTAPFAVGALYASIPEQIFANMLSMMVPVYILKMHWLVICLWFTMATVNVVWVHSGYKHPSTQAHDDHHSKQTGNYGSFFLDYLFGTKITQN